MLPRKQRGRWIVHYQNSVFDDYEKRVAIIGSDNQHIEYLFVRENELVATPAVVRLWEMEAEAATDHSSAAINSD